MPAPKVHYPYTYSTLAPGKGAVANTWRPACGVDGRRFEITEDVAAVTCMGCLRSCDGPNRAVARDRREHQWERARARAKDRREAEKVVLARHAGELEEELALRALARIGS